MLSIFINLPWKQFHCLTKPPRENLRELAQATGDAIQPPLRSPIHPPRMKGIEMSQYFTRQSAIAIAMAACLFAAVTAAAQDTPLTIDEIIAMATEKAGVMESFSSDLEMRRR